MSRNRRSDRKNPSRRRRVQRVPVSRIRPLEMPDTGIHTEYEITYEALDTPEKLPAEVQPIFPELHQLVTDNPHEAVARLEKLLEEYPRCAKLTNLLVAAYAHVGETGRASALAEENYRDHPRYLFARIQQAELCLDRGEVHRVREIFENKWDLKLLYPERDRFHISEFIGFVHVMVQYFLAVGDARTARICFDMLETIEPDHPVTRSLLTRLLLHQVGRSRLRRAVEPLNDDPVPALA